MRIEVRGVRLFVEVVGTRLRPEGPLMAERPTIVALHGGPGFDHSFLRPLLDPLQDAAQVVYVDQRANGRSDAGDPATWRLDDWADDVRALCDVLEIERPVVLGASFGGIVASRYARRHPGHPERLVLVSTPMRYDVDHILAAFERLGGAEAREVARRYWEGHTDEETLAEYDRVCLPLYSPRPAPADALTRAVRREETAAHFFNSEESKSFDAGADLMEAGTPTLLCVGALDPVVPLTPAEQYRDRLELVAFPEAGHLLTYDAPDGVRAAIRAFLPG